MMINSIESREDAVAALDSSVAAERLAGAEHLREALWSRQLLGRAAGEKLRALLADPDEAVRTTAARAVVAKSWRYGDMDRIVVALEADLAVSPQLAEVVVAIANHLPDKHALEQLGPWLGTKLSAPDQPSRAVARTGLANLAHMGFDIAPLAPALDDALGVDDPSEREATLELLYLAAGAKTGLALQAKNVERCMSDAEPIVRFRAARVRVVVAFHAGDDATLETLAHHADAAVREGVANALGALRRWDTFASRGVPHLATLVQDSAGGVAYEAIQGLLLAARDDVDLQRGADAIMAAITRGVSYNWNGHVFPLGPTELSDRRGDDAVSDLAEALTLSDINHPPHGARAALDAGRHAARVQRGLRAARDAQDDD